MFTIENVSTHLDTLKVEMKKRLISKKEPYRYQNNERFK